MPRPRTPLFVVFLPALLLAAYMALVYELSLIYVAFGLFASFVALGAVVSWLGLRGLSVERDHPREVLAGVPFDVSLTVQNRTPALSCMLFIVEDALQRDHVAHPRETAVIALRPAERVTIRYRARVDRRGEYRLADVQLRSRFPFGVFEKRVTVRTATTLLVLPRPGRLSRDLLDARDVAAAESPSPARGGVGEFHGVRPFQPGDNPRAVHWATSARKGGLWVREYERETDRRLLIVLDAAAGADLDRAVTTAATVADHYVAHGWRVALAALHLKPVWVPFGAGPDHLRRTLRALATIRAAVGAREAAWDPRESRGAHAILIGDARIEGLAAVAGSVTRLPLDHPALVEPPPHAAL